MSARIQCVHPRRDWPEYCRAFVLRAKESLPFAESNFGHYAHRVRYVTLHLSVGGSESHLAASCWCGQTVIISKRKHGRLIEAPTQGRPVCATCEGRAIGSGQLGSRVIAGRDVLFRPKAAAA